MVHPEVADAPYFLEILSNLKDKLDDTFHFIISRLNTSEEIVQFHNCIKNDKKNILILLSDEKGIIPPFLEKLYLVFRTYSNSNLVDNKKIFPVPCGFSFGYGGFFGNSDWKYKQTTKKLLVDRKYDIFYSGQFSQNRQDCINVLNNLKNNYNCIVNITDGFAKGFKLEEYYNFMSDSKISIVPNGCVVPESFRYFESFENNCIVVTTFPRNTIYGNWFYNNSPAIFLEEWSQLTNELVDTLLRPDELKKFDIVNQKYFEHNISPLGISNYIYKQITIKENDRGIL